MCQNDPISVFLSQFDYLTTVENRRSTALGRIRLSVFHDSTLSAQLEIIANNLTDILRQVKNPNDPNWHRWLEQIDATLNFAYQVRFKSFCRKYDRPPRTPDEYILPGEFEKNILKGLRQLQTQYPNNPNLSHVNPLILKAEKPGYKSAAVTLQRHATINSTDQEESSACMKSMR